MDYAHLAQIVVEILSPHLGDLLEKKEMDAAAGPETKAVYQLWERVYPKISLRSGAMNAAKDLAAEDTPQRREVLAQQLRSVFRVNQIFGNDLGELIAKSPFSEKLKTDWNIGSQPEAKPSLEPFEQALGIAPSSNETDLACQICGRQDETLRYVEYPFVFSLIVVTNRRAFKGFFCNRHANRYFGLALLITTLFGWWGIPFGMLFTPIALLELMFGGRGKDQLNAQRLMQVGDLKLKGGDEKSAARCFEVSLKYQDDEGVRTKLERLYRKQFPQQAISPLLQLVYLLAGITAAWLVGVAIGILDALIPYLWAGAEEMHFILAALTWMPSVAMVIFGGVIIARIVSWSLSKGQNDLKVIGLGVALLAAVLGIYGVPTGSALVFSLSSPEIQYASILEVLRFIGEMLTSSGLNMIFNIVTGGARTDLIYLAILFLGGLFYILLAGREALRVAVWQKRLNQLRGEAGPSRTASAGAGCLSIAGVVGAFGIVALVTFSGMGYSGDPEAQEHVDAAFALMDQGEYEQAMEEANAALVIDPDYTDAYMILGFANVELGYCGEALATLEDGLAVAADDYVPYFHFFLGMAHMCSGDLEPAIEAFEQSAAIYPGFAEVQFYLGAAYSRTGDFDQALKWLESAKDLDPEWSPIYGYLAVVYYYTGQDEAREEALAQALDYAGESEYGYWVLGHYYRLILDFESSERYFNLAWELTPMDSGTVADLTNIYATQKKFDKAQALIDQFVENFEPDADILIAQSDLYIQMKELDKALEGLVQAEEYVGEDRGDLSGIFSDRSFIYFQQGDYRRAEKAAATAIEIQTYNSGAHSRAAFAYYEMGDIGAACLEAEEARRLRPTYDLPHYILGLCALEGGDTDEAIAEFETFLELTWERAYVGKYQDLARDLLDELLK